MRAKTCFMCGQDLTPSRRAWRELLPSWRRLPLADIALFSFILFILLTWLRYDNERRVLALTPTATPTLTATPTP
ncbi:MAG: hypothetical protein D6802_06550, partial [Ardenticatenia bacterium]